MRAREVSLALSECQQIISPDLVGMGLQVLSPVRILARSNKGLVPFGVEDVCNSILVLYPIVDFKTSVSAGPARLFICPSQVGNSMMGIGVVSAGLVDAGDSDCHLFLLALLHVILIGPSLLQLADQTYAKSAESRIKNCEQTDAKRRYAQELG